MWWKKKKVAVAAGGGSGTEVTPQGRGAEEVPKLEIARQKVEKLPGPKRVPKMIELFLIDEYKIDPEIVEILKMVMRHRQQKEKIFDCIIFDPEEAEALGVKVVDYNSLSDHTDMILYDGWFDEDSKQVELSEKRKMDYGVPILTLQEIQQKIEELADPGNSVFFYQARGPAAGGPLGRGAALVEFNPPGEKKKGKKYTVYTSNMFKMDLVGEPLMLYSSDKSVEIAKWIKNAYHKRGRLSESEE